MQWNLTALEIKVTRKRKLWAGFMKYRDKYRGDNSFTVALKEDRNFYTFWRSNHDSLKTGPQFLAGLCSRGYTSSWSCWMPFRVTQDSLCPSVFGVIGAISLPTGFTDHSIIFLWVKPKFGNRSYKSFPLQRSSFQDLVTGRWIFELDHVAMSGL